MDTIIHTFFDFVRTSLDLYLIWVMVMVTIMELTYMNLIILMCTTIMLSTYLLKTEKSQLLLLKTTNRRINNNFSSAKFLNIKLMFTEYPTKIHMST